MTQPSKYLTGGILVMHFGIPALELHS
jgi:hypothetical protein